jgi:hypothetical protein
MADAAVYGLFRLEQHGSHLKFGAAVELADIVAAANKVLVAAQVLMQLNQSAEQT